MEKTTAGEAAGLKILSGIQDVELDPTEVQELFNHPHPLQLNEAQRAVIVEALRRKRGEYIIQKEQKAAKRRAKEYKSADESAKISLDDLKLNLEDLV